MNINQLIRKMEKGRTLILVSAVRIFDIIVSFSVALHVQRVPLLHITVWEVFSLWFYMKDLGMTSHVSFSYRTFSCLAVQSHSGTVLVYTRSSSATDATKNIGMCLSQTPKKTKNISSLHDGDISVHSKLNVRNIWHFQWT